jgi:hypothetical protein
MDLVTFVCKCRWIRCDVVRLAGAEVHKHESRACLKRSAQQAQHAGDNNVAAALLCLNESSSSGRTALRLIESIQQGILKVVLLDSNGSHRQDLPHRLNLPLEIQLGSDKIQAI